MSAAYKRRRALPKHFVPLIFKREQITLSDCVPVFVELERNPQSLSRLFSNEEIFLELLSDFDRYASRISRFFYMFKKYSVDHLHDITRQKPWLGPALANELTERILLPLLGDDFSQFSLSYSFLDVFSTVLNCCLPYRLHSFEKLGARLLKEKLVFAALISGKTGGVVKQWISVFINMISDCQTLRAWAMRLIEQCESCEGDHDIDQQKHRWQGLDTLLPRLIIALRNHPQPTPDTPLQPLNLNSDLTLALQQLGVSPPSTGHALEETIYTLEKDETVRMLKAASESFPCRHCYKSSTGRECTDLDQNQRESCMRVDFGHFADLLGPGIGMWRVLASREALEDMEQAYEEGSFVMVESIIMQLASGMWEDPPIRRPFNAANEFLYLAPYGQDKSSAVLWELDVEFDEAEGVLLQLIRIWRVGKIETIEQEEVPHIRLIHKTSSEVRLDAHRSFKVDQKTRIAYPTVYGTDSNRLRGTLQLGDKSQEQLGKSLLKFNRFYIVTQTTFENIRAENLTAEYPLSLAEEELEIVKDTSNSTLIQGRSGTGKTTCLVYKLFGRYLASRDIDIANSPRQVLLTRSHVLSSKLRDYTKRLISTHSSESGSPGGDNNGLNFMLGDDEREVNHTIFTILADDFPLVCTFNNFLKILENTLRASEHKDFSFFSTQKVPIGNTQHKKEPGRRLYRKSQVVDFEVFSEQYWEKFPTILVKGISPTSAFMEIIGVIKGAACVIEGAACYLNVFQPLTRECYVNKGHTISPIDVDRHRMYDIYLQYEKVKRGFGDLDDIDRTRDVLNWMTKNPDVRSRIQSAFDEIYIDEIQDQRLLEIMLLLQLIKAPNAVHFAGDTAQSISKDSVFRFENIKDLLYARFSSEKKISPRVHELYKNYRTHQEILNVATSVMGLLCTSFPEMVDRMEEEEKAQFFGPTPVMFVGIGSEVLSSSMFGATDLAADCAQFGADQVIIVRDESKQKKVRKEIGDFALVLTILESKGMEFEDVLLLDFFSTSDCLSAWRTAQSGDFKPVKNLAFCSELKQLYVTITRAQYRLWFFESDAASVKDVLTPSLWKPIVDEVSSNDCNLRERLAQLRPGKNADPEIWSRRGYQFIENKNYESALLCFRRAGDQKGKDLTTALLSERKAKSLLVRGEEKASEEYFRKAAKLFHECEQGLREASCYEALGEFEEAGNIFAMHHEFSRAAGLYIRAKSFKKASDNFVLAGRFLDAASALSRGRRFDSLVLYLNKHSVDLDPAYQRHYTRLCMLLVRRGKISPELVELVLSTLTDEEKEEFFRDYEMKEQLSKLLIKQGRYSDLCRETVARGDLAEAWNIGHEYGGMEQLSLDDRIEVYMHRQVQALHENLSPITAELFAHAYPSIPQSSWLSDAPSIVRFWRNLPENLDSFWKHKITYESLVFDQLWMKQIFDLIVTLKAHAFITSAISVTELPVESIATAVTLTKELLIESNPPKTLLNFLGIIRSKKKADELVVLPSSILRDGSDATTGLKSRTLVDQVASWIIDCLCRAVSELYPVSRELCYNANPCLAFQYRGYHDNPKCKLVHRPSMEKPEYTTMIKDFLRMASIMFSFLPLHYNQRFRDLAPKSFKADLRGAMRGSLERLIAGITYITSVEQSPEVLRRTWDEIRKPNSPLNSGVYGGLAELLFHRLKENLDTICDISSMLEQLQIAQCLGLRPNFESNLAYSVLKKYPACGSYSPSNFDSRSGSFDEKAWQSWETLQTISSSLDDSGIGLHSIEALDKMIRDADSTDLRSYHAIIALYEEWATYLIHQSSPSDILLPQSWVSLYKDLLPPLLPASNAILINRRREDLLFLMESFCSLVKKVNFWNPSPVMKIEDNIQFQHKFLGRIRAKGQGIHIFSRRNAHFLSTCLLNALSWQTNRGPNMDIHLQVRRLKVGDLVHKTLNLQFAMLPGFESRTSFPTLCRDYLGSFNVYGGKDRPQIVTATKNVSTSFYPLLPLVSKQSFEELNPPLDSEDTTAVSQSNDENAHLFNDYDNIEPSVVIIQRMWRSRYPIVCKRRNFFGGPLGRSLAFISGICAEVVDSSALDRTEIIRRRFLFFTVGIQIHLLAEAVERLYKKSRDKAKHNMSKGKMSGIEYAQVWWEKLLEMQKKVSQNTCFFAAGSLNSLRQHDSLGLEKRMQEVYHHLHDIEFSLTLLDPETRNSAAAIIIQRAFRKQRRVLKLRREFRATEAGKTIAYVKRIVVALNMRDPLDRIGEIRRAWVLFNHVAQLIEKVKAIEITYKKAKRAVRFRMNWAEAEEKQNARVVASHLKDIRELVRNEALFLLEENWMQLNIPSIELEEKCMETWRVMVSVENSLFRFMYQ